MIERSFWALRQSAGSQSGGVALKKICLNELEEFIVFEQPAKPLPTRVRTPARAWGPSRRGSWDRIYRLSLRWLRLSRDCEQQNPSSTGPFRTRNYLEPATTSQVSLGSAGSSPFRFNADRKLVPWLRKPTTHGDDIDPYSRCGPTSRGSYALM